MCAEMISGAADRASRDLGRGLHRVPLDLEVDEHGQRQAEERAVEHGGVTGDHPGGLQGAQPAQARRRRHVQPLGERGVRDPAFALQDGQHLAVDTVQGHDRPLTGSLKGRSLRNGVASSHTK